MGQTTVNTEKAIISPAAGLRAKSIISPGRTDTEFYYQSGYVYI